MTTKNKKTAFYTALAKAPGLLKEYIKQYTQGQVDFPDELVEAFTQAQGDVRKIEQMCNNLKKSKEGAQIMKVAEQVYNAAQQEIDSEIQSTGMFKDGGKVNYLRKLSGGNTIPEETNRYKLKRHGFQSDTLNVTPGYRIISQSFYPIYENTTTGRESWGDFDSGRGRVLYDSPTGRQEVYFNYPDNYISSDNGYMPVGTTKNQESAKKLFWDFLLKNGDPKNPDVQKVKAEKHGWGGIVDKASRLHYNEATPSYAEEAHKHKGWLSEPPVRTGFDPRTMIPTYSEEARKRKDWLSEPNSNPVMDINTMKELFPELFTRSIRKIIK